jgi:hypothetical protein
MQIYVFLCNMFYDGCVYCCADLMEINEMSWPVLTVVGLSFAALFQGLPAISSMLQFASVKNSMSFQLYISAALVGNLFIAWASSRSLLRQQ